MVFADGKVVFVSKLFFEPENNTHPMFCLSLFFNQEQN
jgi:hypothetical protein